jgi:hypothetical protein
MILRQSQELDGASNSQAVKADGILQDRTRQFASHLLAPTCA